MFEDVGTAMRSFGAAMEGLRLLGLEGGCMRLSGGPVLCDGYEISR